MEVLYNGTVSIQHLVLVKFEQVCNFLQSIVYYYYTYFSLFFILAMVELLTNLLLSYSISLGHLEYSKYDFVG